jgi:hypothetical protein
VPSHRTTTATARIANTIASRDEVEHSGGVRLRGSTPPVRCLLARLARARWRGFLPLSARRREGWHGLRNPSDNLGIRQANCPKCSDDIQPETAPRSSPWMTQAKVHQPRRCVISDRLGVRGDNLKSVSRPPPVWRDKVVTGCDFWGRQKFWVVPVCGECKTKYRYDPWNDPKPCIGCGRSVYNLWDWKGRYVVCSGACEPAARAKRARDLRAKSREGLTCEQCGKSFTPPRNDAKFCSSACRQQAYRNRCRPNLHKPKMRQSMRPVF